MNLSDGSIHLINSIGYLMKNIRFKILKKTLKKEAISKKKLIPKMETQEKIRVKRF